MHDEPPPHEVARVGECALGIGGVCEHHVGIAPASHLQRLPAPDRHDFHLEAGLGFEQRQQRVEQAGVTGGGGRRQQDFGLLGSDEEREQEREHD